MKLSNKEKILLVILGTVLVGTLYYQFIYTKQRDKIERLKEEKFKIETKYQEVMKTINLLEDKQEKVNSMTSTVNFKSKKFYPIILQEKIILDLDNFLKNSALKADIGFSDISIQSIEVVQSKNKEKKESTFKDIVNEYKGLINLEEEQEGKSEPDKNKSVETTVEVLKANITFKGIYDSVKSFISKIETSNRQIAITDISATVGYNGELTGSMNIEFYAIPKISDRDGEYLDWNMDGTYGKKNPFLIQRPEVSVQSPISNDSESSSNSITNNQVSQSDFVAIVKSINSDLPTVMIGKANDSNKETYINMVKNNIEKAELELNKKDGKYYYKYKNSDKQYPEDYSGNGVEFIPTSDRIIIDISSESRVNIDDKSGLQLNILNVTDKIVEVRIKNDDKINPRVSISGDSSKITITRK